MNRHNKGTAGARTKGIIRAECDEGERRTPQAVQVESLSGISPNGECASCSSAERDGKLMFGYLKTVFI